MTLEFLETGQEMTSSAQKEKKKTRRWYKTK